MSSALESAAAASCCSLVYIFFNILKEFQVEKENSCFSFSFGSNATSCSVVVRIDAKEGGDAACALEFGVLALFDFAAFFELLLNRSRRARPVVLAQFSSKIPLGFGSG